MAISGPSVNMLCFSTVCLLCCSIHVPQAAITNRLPQHLPAVHHGEHKTDHPQWLYHFPADASHPSTWHGPWLVTTGTACHNPLCTWSSRYGPSPAKSPAGERLWVGGTVACRLCACEVVATFSRRPEANDLVKFCWFALYTGAATDLAAAQFLYGSWFFKFPFAAWLPFKSWPLFHCHCSPVAYWSICIWKH